MSPAFVGFIIVALVGAAAEMAAAFSGARKNRLDLSVGIALGSAAQIALFVAVKKSPKNLNVDLVLSFLPIVPVADFGMHTSEKCPCESKSRYGRG